ncbi:GntR family transcriptional regulator [Desulfitibacter alkalitolerans]|uniref:GntR family transcriptional regulator n=1 Tax=Desulfitibacter alkalitolerans TaxID=264641 RepID=UPI000550366D|nr:GntR family transcriptional regulator [Desulfitibacter alkalitolerans]
MGSPDTGQSLMDMAYEIIKKRIINLTYPPGSSLTEAGLAQELQTSRMPIRMAVRRLENEGWLIADYRKKIRVKDITRKDVLEIYQIRSLLESNALEMIFDLKKTWEYSHRIEEKVVRIKASQKDLYEWELADTEMHMEIVSIYENERINRIYRSNQDELIRIGLMSQKREGHVEEIIAGLYKFVEAIRQENLSEAMEILRRDHLEAGQELALAKVF